MYYKYIFKDMHESLTEITIGNMVDTFYARVREDDLLGPVFAEAIGSDWEPHLKKMKAFWSSVLLASRTYKGNPMIAHLQLPLLKASHFERWLQLWSETADALCSSALALFSIKERRRLAPRCWRRFHATENSRDRFQSPNPKSSFSETPPALRHYYVPYL